MNLKQIEAFVCVADEKNFSKAASALFLTQPTVSAHVSSLEEELNTTLFIRTAKGAELTQDGKRLYLYAKQMIELHDTILHQFGETERKPVIHQVVIAASTIPAQYLLPEILARYSRQYPDARFSVRETDSAGVIREITEHTAEIGFTGTMPDKKRCAVYPFFEDELVLITPNTDHYRSLSSSGEETMKWLSGEPVILREEGSGTRKETESYLRKKGIRVSDLHVVATIGSPEAIMRSVKSGVGCTVISRLAAQESIDKKEVLGFSFGDGGAKRSMYMIAEKGTPLSDAAKRLIQVVRQG